jgi:hypothetical protein
MFFRRRARRVSKSNRTKTTRNRTPRIESLEDRSLLAVMADVVFLVDQSASTTNIIEQWLSESVVQPDGLHNALVAGGIDVRYGLVGFGAGGELGVTAKFARSYVVDGGTYSSGTDHVADIKTAINNLGTVGAVEDGWDAIEAAIAEYPFRDGAVSMLVHVQNGSGRIDFNTTLVRDGVLRALESKNVVFNSNIAGGQPDLSGNTKLFPIDRYATSTNDFANRRVIGVEADSADGVHDGQHNYYLFDTSLGQFVTAKPQTTTSNALQVSFDGSNTGATGMVATGKSGLMLAA